MVETKVKAFIAWTAVLLLAIFTASLHQFSDPVSIKVFPTVAKEGEPMLITFTLRNFDISKMPADFEFYVNGERVIDGTTELKPFSSQLYQYFYESPLKLGEQANFLVRVKTPFKVYEELLSTPSYPPQVWTSFVSFASFSNTATSYMTTIAYYEDTFDVNAINVGLIFTLVLIPLLVFSVLAEPYTRKRTIIGRLNTRFSRLSTILFIIFMLMVLTQIVMIISF